MKSFSSIRSRLALLLLIALSLILALTYHTYTQERKLFNAQLEENVQRLAFFAAETHEHCIEATMQLLLALAKLCEVQTGTLSQCRVPFSEVLRENPDIANLGILDLDGALLCSATPIPDTAGFADRPWFRQTATSNEPAMGVYQAVRTGTTPAALTFSRPVQDRNNRPMAVIFAVLNLAQLNQFAFQEQLPPDAEFLLVNSGGVILCHFPESGDWVGKSPRGIPILDLLLGGKKSLADTAGLDGVNRLYAFAPLSGVVETGLYVAIGIPHQKLYGKAGRILAMHFAGLALVCLVVFLAVWFGSRLMIISRVNALVRAAGMLSEGDAKARTGVVYGNSELDRLARAFDEMADGLENRAAQLQGYQEQLRSLASELSLAEERERHRIATELHDRVAQTLAICKMKLGMLRSSAPSPEIGQSVMEIRSLVDRAIKDIRSLIFKISSPVLYELGLESALESLVEQTGSEHGLDVSYEDDGRDKPVGNDIRILLFRSVNELLVNIVKHAHARSVRVASKREGNEVVISVADDGVGFDPGACRLRDCGGYGIFSIRERLSHAGGRLEATSKPHEGSCFTIFAPLNCPPSHEQKSGK